MIHRSAMRPRRVHRGLWSILCVLFSTVVLTAFSWAAENIAALQCRGASGHGLHDPHRHPPRHAPGGLAGPPDHGGPIHGVNPLARAFPNATTANEGGAVAQPPNYGRPTVLRRLGNRRSLWNDQNRRRNARCGRIAAHLYMRNLRASSLLLAASRTSINGGGLNLRTLPGVQNAASSRPSEVKNREEDYLW